GSGAEGATQRAFDRRRDWSGGRVDILCADDYAGELLGKIGFFVCRPGADEEADRVRSVRLDNIGDPSCRTFDNAIKGRRHLDLALPDQVSGQALAWLDGVVVEAATDADLVVA